MPTDFEKQFGDYGNLTDSLGLGPAAMASGQYPNRAEESQATRLIRLAGKGATFGLDTSQTPIEAENIAEHVAEFGGSIPSTIAASAIAGPALGLIPKFAKLGPLARGVGTAGALGGAVGTGKAIQSGDITDIPSETAWWAGSELAGQGLFRGAAKLLGKGAKIAPPEVPGGTMHGPTAPSAAEREFWQSIETQNKIDKGNVINRILNPDDLSSTVPTERTVIPSQGPRTFLPPKEIPTGLTAGEGPAVRMIKVGEDAVNFDEIPDLVLDLPKAQPPRRMVELHRGETPGQAGETFTTDRQQALREAKTSGGYLKSMEVPEGDLAKYQKGMDYEVPSATQKELGVGEHQPMDVPYYQREVNRAAKIQPAEPRKPIEMSLEDEFGNQVVPERLGPLTEGQAARQAFPSIPDSDAVPFRLAETPPPPTYQPIRRPSLDGFVEKVHENPINAENMAKPLKEVMDPKTGTTMVVPKTAQAGWVMDMAGKIQRNIEPPITSAMREDIIKPLNKAKLDHGIQVEQYKTSNLLKKSEEEIERITKDAEGRLVVKPLQFKSIVESEISQRIEKNLARQGMTTDDMKAFVMKKSAEWDMSTQPGASLETGARTGMTGKNKQAWLKNEIANELKRRGPC